MGESNNSLEKTPTWAVSVCALVFFFLAFIIENSLHHLSQFLKRKEMKSFGRALGKIESEMMKMGFISLLLTITGAPISNICVSKGLATSFLPCKDPLDHQFSMEPAVLAATQTLGSNSEATLPALNSDQTYCRSKGMVSLMSREGVLELNILISVLAVFHVLYCILTMCLGIAKMRKWKAWEEETQALEYQIVNDPRRFRLARQTSLGRRHLNFYASHPLLVWPVCLVRQFSGSVSKTDYFTLRHGFIVSNIAEGTEFNFQKFLHRAFDYDFLQVIQIRFWIWIFSILFIFFSAHEFYNYYWLPFIPLVVMAIVVSVGTKLEVIITKMCVESSRRNPVSRGAFLVKPNDELFWFGRPSWVLHLIQFILIQNSFQLAFFTWTWFEFGVKSCFSRRNEDIAIRIVMGVGVQLLCGYVTLPLYALVTQMGSGLKSTVFADRIIDGLKNWRKRSKRRNGTALSKSATARSNHQSCPANSANKNSTTVTDEILLPPPAIPSLSRPPSGQEITVEEGGVPNNNTPDQSTVMASTSQIRTRKSNFIKGNYDGEISFASSWKQMEIQWVGEEADHSP